MSNILKWILKLYIIDKNCDPAFDREQEVGKFIIDKGFN